MERLEPGGGTWERVKDMIQPRSEFSLTAVGGKLYAVGGRDNGRYHISTIECYDPVTNSWTEVGSLPQGKSYMGEGKNGTEEL